MHAEKSGRRNTLLPVPNRPTNWAVLAVVARKSKAHPSHVMLAEALAPVRHKPTDKRAPHNTIMASQMSAWPDFGHALNLLNAIA